MRHEDAYQVGLALEPLIAEQLEHDETGAAKLWSEAQQLRLPGREAVYDVRSWRTLPALAYLADYRQGRLDNGARFATFLLEIVIDTEWTRRIAEMRGMEPTYTREQVAAWLEKATVGSGPESTMIRHELANAIRSGALEAP